MICSLLLCSLAIYLFSLLILLMTSFMLAGHPWIMSFLKTTTLSVMVGIRIVFQCRRYMDRIFGFLSRVFILRVYSISMEMFDLIPLVFMPGRLLICLRRRV